MSRFRRPFSVQAELNSSNQQATLWLPSYSLASILLFGHLVGRSHNLAVATIRNLGFLIRIGTKGAQIKV